MPTPTRKLFFLITTLSPLILLTASFVCAQECEIPPHQQSVAIEINAQKDRKPINPNIYGVASAGYNGLADLNCPLNRRGGNQATRYNWKLNAVNSGNDWYYESWGDDSDVAGERYDTDISNCKATGSQAMLTIPMIDWIAKLGTGRSKLCSFSIAKYGAQEANDSNWFPDAGNGILLNGDYVTNNDPNDANVPNNLTFQSDWMKHLVAKWGTAKKGGLRYYILDNEIGIWHDTHRDVHPIGASMDVVKNKIVEYAAKIKEIDPSALTVAPEEWGWWGYFISGYDLEYANRTGDWTNLPDRINHGNWDYVPWLLDQLHKNNVATGKRLLDIFSLHFYPGANVYTNGWSDVTVCTQLKRNRTTRTLWDPGYNYAEDSWWQINDVVKLIPRMKDWVNTYYPGTQIAITEYSWGADEHINGATAQADILGIFGREDLDMACHWTTPEPETPTYKAFKMYRNYDGKKSTFGDISVSDNVTANPDELSSFAAVRSSDGAMTVMVVNKVLEGKTNVSIKIAGFTPKRKVQVWQLTSANKMVRQKDIRIKGKRFKAIVPSQSITLFVIPSL